MRYTFAYIFCLLTAAALLLTSCATQSRPVSDRDGSRPIVSTSEAPRTLDELLEREDFDLARALLLFSAEYRREFEPGADRPDIEAMLEVFEAWTDELKREIRRAGGPRARLRTLVDFIHLKLGLRFDAGDMVGQKPDNLFFDRVLQRRYGYCVTLSAAYLVFGRAAGLDVSGVRLPGHFAVLYRDREGREVYETLVETTDFGRPRDEAWYWSKHRFSTQSVEAGVYLTPLNNHQVMGTLFNNLAGLTYLRGLNELAEKRYTRALELAPKNAEALYNRALVRRQLGRAVDAMEDVNHALRLDPNFVTAMLLRSGLLWEGGEREQARKVLDRALLLRPDWPEPHILDGKFLAEQGRVDDAKASFERALEADPGNQDALIAMKQLEDATRKRQGTRNE